LNLSLELGSINDPEIMNTSFAAKGGVIVTAASGPRVASPERLPPPSFARVTYFKTLGQP